MADKDLDQVKQLHVHQFRERLARKSNIPISILTSAEQVQAVVNGIVPSAISNSDKQSIEKESILYEMQRFYKYFHRSNQLYDNPYCQAAEKGEYGFKDYF
jgi:hypothetical protein